MYYNICIAKFIICKFSIRFQLSWRRRDVIPDVDISIHIAFVRIYD